MKVELEIITDRLPTEEDGEWVLVWSGKLWKGAWRDEISSASIWMRQPPPPKPPIDVSLAASIWRYCEGIDGPVSAVYYDNPGLVSEDIDRIIEAARKWDEHEREIARLCKNIEGFPAAFAESVRQVTDARGTFTEVSSKGIPSPICKANNDPDGVGEGWRVVRIGEELQDGDEGRSEEVIDVWAPTINRGVVRFGRNYRRRITSEETQ